jgi:hypothetical protein
MLLHFLKANVSSAAWKTGDAVSRNPASFYQLLQTD